MAHVANRFLDKIIPYSPAEPMPDFCAVIGMPEGVYHSIPGFSQSYAKEFQKSPAHGKAYLEKEWEIDPKREMYKAVHLLCLEPEEQKRLVVRDGRWSGALKEEVESLQKAGNIVLKADAFVTANAMAMAVESHSTAYRALKASLSEVSLFWIEETEFGPVRCKARIDMLSLADRGIYVGDLKSFGSLFNEVLIGDQVAKSGYINQLAWYDRAVLQVFGESSLMQYWVFVEDSAPHGVKLRFPSPRLLGLGWKALSALLPQYATCVATNTWPGYAEDEAEITMPPYFLKENENEQV